MVIVSHDREFLDQLCTKIVETEGGVSTTYPGNYTKYTAAKAERTAQQWAAYEKQQKEIARLVCAIGSVGAYPVRSRTRCHTGRTRSKGTAAFSLAFSFLKKGL